MFSADCGGSEDGSANGFFGGGLVEAVEGGLDGIPGAMLSGVLLEKRETEE